MADTGTAALAAFSASLNRAGLEAQAKARAVMRKGATDIQADAQRLAPVDTGFLRSSIGITFQGNQYFTSFTVAPTADYAGYVEFGTSRQAPQPFMQPALDRNLPRIQAALGIVLGGDLMAATQVRLSSLTDGVRAVLSGVGGFPAADVHDGVVTNPTLIAGTNLIQPYAVVWLGPGDEIDRVLGGATGGGEHRLYVTVAASTQGKCLDAVDRARRILDGAWLSLSGHQVGIRWLEGYYSQPAQRDPDAPSDRWYVPLIFTALI